MTRPYIMHVAREPHRNMRAWTEAEIAILIRLWRHFTAREIGEQLGRSRNSVIGQVHRLRLNHYRPKTITRDRRASAPAEESVGFVSLPAATGLEAVPRDTSPEPSRIPPVAAPAFPGQCSEPGCRGTRLKPYRECVQHRRVRAA